jgi:hypothetical protein
MIEVTASVTKMHKFELWNHSLENGVDPSLNPAMVEALLLQFAPPLFSLSCRFF